MALQDILGLSAIFLGSTVKYSVVAATVVATNAGIAGTIANVLGGIAGIVVFAQIDEVVQNWFIKRNPEKFGKRFSKRTRFLARVKNTFGLWGIAFLTPLIFSIPIGVFFALDLTTNKRKVIFQMIVACIFWAAIIYTPYYLFDIDVVAWVKGLTGIEQ